MLKIYAKILMFIKLVVFSYNNYARSSVSDVHLNGSKRYFLTEKRMPSRVFFNKKEKTEREKLGKANNRF